MSTPISGGQDRARAWRRTRRSSASAVPGPTSRSAGLRVGWILLLVASVPLVGMSIVTYSAVRGIGAVADASDRTVVLAERATALAKLDGAVFDETLWHAMSDVTREAGIPESMLTLLGVDPSQDRADAIARTDELIASADADDVTDDLVQGLMAARSPELRLRHRLTAYGDLSRRVEGTLETTLSELDAAALVVGDDTSMGESAAALGMVVRLRGAVADSFYGFFATTIDLRDEPAIEIARLIDARVEYDTAMRQLNAASTDSSRLASGIASVADSDELREFIDALDVRIDDALTDGVPDRAPAVTLANLSNDFDGFTAIFEGGTSLSSTTLELLDAATESVLAAADDVRAAAQHDIRRTYGLAIVLTLATAVGALLAARFIVRPLRQLQRAAEGLQADTPVVGEVDHGPAEVRAAARAIRETTGHFDLVTRQARALAAGNLDDDVLFAPAPGGLGAALRHAVATLRSALAQQDEFRRRLAHEATHDGLTKLPNRSASMAQLTRSLARTRRSGAQVAVLFIDLDHFKEVNDLHGHQAGDAVLTAVATRLVNAVREGDHVGRLGGDEFVVIAEPVEGIDAAVTVAEHILRALGEPVELSNVPVTIGASIGIAISEDPRLTAEELLRDADLAVYRVKETGRGGLEICDETLRAEVAQTADLSVAIRHAIDRDELTLHYQAIVDTLTEEVRAFEALVRWQRPGEPRLVPPDEFIGFAERSSLIIDLDRWVIEAVARQMSMWRDDGRFAEVPVAVNLSGRHLGHPDLVRHVLDPLQRHGVEPTMLIVEVTESALLDDLATAATQLNELRAAGVRVSIDDFGTGYTSLAHLRSLPFDILKIDRSFTANAPMSVHEASIVKLIIDTGHLLGAVITAEGVETTIEAAKLAELGSDSLQGYYYARPQAPGDLTGMPVTSGASTAPARGA